VFGAELTVVGDIITAPILKTLANGNSVVSFSLLVKRAWKDRDGGERTTSATFVATAWGQTADNVAGSLSKGDRVLVMGRLEERSWQDEHRQEHTRLELNVSDIGPTLFFGPVTVTKNPRRGEAPTDAAGRAPAARTTRDEDEEPF
jgi:single-strand DNA-binding protein